jgi:hypothetical protein
MKGRVIFLLLAVTASILYGQNEIRDTLSEGINPIVQSVPEKIVVSFGNFTYADKGIGSRFSMYLEEQLALVLAEEDNFEVFEREKLEEILEAMELSLSDLVDPESAVQAGKLKGVQAIFSGNFFESGDRILVYLDLTSVETGTTIAKSEISISRAAIPPAITVVPDNYNDALFVLEELSEVVNADNKDFVVKAWTKRGNGGTYYSGEKLVIHFYASRDCFIKIYHIDVDRKILLIFPNSHYSNNFVKGQKLYTIPDSHYGFTFTLEPPFGTEFVKVVASTVQFEDIEVAFEELGSTSRELVQRGLGVKKTKQQVTESMINYTILER